MSRYKYDKSILWHRSHSLSFNRVLLVDAFNKRIGKTFTCHKWKFYYLNERTAVLPLTPLPHHPLNPLVLPRTTRKTLQLDFNMFFILFLFFFCFHSCRHAHQSAADNGQIGAGSI